MIKKNVFKINYCLLLLDSKMWLSCIFFSITVKGCQQLSDSLPRNTPEFVLDPIFEYH